MINTVRATSLARGYCLGPIIIVTLIGWVIPAHGYEHDVHLSLTMWLTEVAGFSTQEAYEIAKYDQATDDDPATQPLPTVLTGRGTDRREKYHAFGSSTQAL